MILAYLGRYNKMFEYGKLSNVFGRSFDAFVTTESGAELTDRQEVFCWRYALHGNAMKAHREAYAPSTAKVHNVNSSRLKRRAKIAERVIHLRRLHDTNHIDLRKGPWEYYGSKLTVGAPEEKVVKAGVNLAGLAQA